MAVRRFCVAAMAALMSLFFAVGHAALLPEVAQEDAKFRYMLWLDDTNTAYRNLRALDKENGLAWEVKHDGAVVLERNAQYDTGYRYFRGETGKYTITLVDSSGAVRSNTVSYTVTRENPHVFMGTPPGRFYLARYLYRISVGDDFEVSRSMPTDKAPKYKSKLRAWVIIQDSRVVLERCADKEMSYKYYRNKPGASYEVYLVDWIDGMKCVVSNTVRYTIPAERK